jgi:hypothetical protein
MQCPETFVLRDKIEARWLTQFMKCLELAKGVILSLSDGARKKPDYIEKDNLTVPIMI